MRCTNRIFRLLFAATLTLAVARVSCAQTTQINTLSDLQNMSLNLSGSYVLGGNIDASASASMNGGTGFIPIGTASAPFTGTFNGNGYTITGVTINSTLQYVGLFGDITGATVENVNLSQISVTSTGSLSNVGTLVGGMFNGSSVSNSSASGSVTAANAGRLGGLVGWSYTGTITGCAASTAVTSSTAGGDIGGLVGANQFMGPPYIGGGSFYPSVVTNSQASGSVSGTSAYIGGLAGSNTSVIKQSRSSGSVTGAGGSLAGGLIGANGPSAYSTATGQTYLVDTVENSFSTSTVVNGSGGAGGGLIGQNIDSQIIGDFATGSVSNSAGGSAEGGLIGQDESSTVEQSYATGNVTGTSSTALAGLIGTRLKWNGLNSALQQTYSIGAVQGLYASCVGGLVGCDSTGSGASCSYWATDTSFQSSSADGTGVLLAQLETGTLMGCFATNTWTDTSGAPPTLIANPAPASGYINPKYQIMGVTYAPPGASTSTFVQYQNSTTVGSTQSISQSFKDENSLSVSVSLNAGVSGYLLSGGSSIGVSYDTSQQAKTTSTVTTSMQVQQGEKTFGTDNYYSPVNHDYDLIWVWLNPLALFTVYPAGSSGSAPGTLIEWNGYGFDANDQPDLDIVGIPLGYLNGDFGPMPPQYLLSLERTWAAGQAWPTGQGAALTSADFAQIASADPFSNPDYGFKMIGADPPFTETSDHRFTVSTCNGGSSFPYDQASPSSSAETYTCTLTNTNASTQAKDIINTYSVQFTLDAKAGLGGILADFTAELKEQNTLTWTTEYQSSITNTSSSTASLSVQSPPCNNAIQGLGPCIPVYDSTGNQPVQFSIYQDNMYGTFMFAPVGYYTVAPTAVATPTFGPVAGSYFAPQSVTITTTTSGAVIYYTTDGTTPTTVSSQYSGPISVAKSETLQAIAVASGYTQSAVGAASYTITGLGPASTPTFAPAAGTYNVAQSVSLSDTITGAKIYYTTDGTTPTTSSTLYSAPITVGSSEIIEAIAVANGYTNSPAAVATYTITAPSAAASPTFSVTPGTYTTAQTVAITDSAPNSTIYYSTNGSVPTANSAVYTSPIVIATTETLEAMAVAPGYTQSPVVSATYTITTPMATPTFQLSANPNALTIKAGQSGSASITIVPLNGFNSAITLACSGLSAGMGCTFNAASVTPSGGTATSTLTITTTAESASVFPAHSGRSVLYCAIFLPSSFLLILLGMPGRRKSLTKLFLSTIVLGTFALGISSCGSTGTNSASLGASTPIGTNAITIVGLTSGSNATSQTTSIAVTVK